MAPFLFISTMLLRTGATLMQIGRRLMYIYNLLEHTSEDATASVNHTHSQ